MDEPLAAPIVGESESCMEEFMVVTPVSII
jgi:hypothetical protein